MLLVDVLVYILLCKVKKKGLRKMITSLNTANAVENNIPLAKSSPYANNENNTKTENYPDSSIVTFSVDANNLMENQKIENQLSNIFGTNKMLTQAQEEEIDNINKEIDSILGIKPLSKEQKASSDKIMQSIDNIFKDGQVTTDEEKQLKVLDDKMSKLHGFDENKQLSPADEKKLDSLFAKLDNILGLPMLSKGDLLSIDPSQENATMNFPPFKKLTDSEQKQADNINKEIDKIYGAETLSKKDMALSDKLHKEIDDLFKDGKLTNEEEAKLESLGKRLDDLYGTPKVLSEADNKKIQELFQSLDKLHGFNDVSKDSLIKAEGLYSILDGNDF